MFSHHVEPEKDPNLARKARGEAGCWWQPSSLGPGHDQINPVMGWTVILSDSYIEVSTSRTSECDLIWK